MKHAAILNGGDRLGEEDFLNRGFFDDADMDPSTCGVGSLFMPFGPWPTCKPFALYPEETLPMLYECME